MTSKEYQKPSVRTRHITYEAALCGNSPLEKNPDEGLDPEGEGAWGKEGNLEGEGLGYQPYSVWED